MLAGAARMVCCRGLNKRADAPVIGDRPIGDLHCHQATPVRMSDQADGFGLKQVFSVLASFVDPFAIITSVRRLPFG
jgi:hypothetical protein